MHEVEPAALNPLGLSDGVVVYDGLDSTNGTYALSANQGRILNEKIPTPATDAEIDALFT